MSAAQHPAVQEFDALLQSLQSLKPPGISKQKVEDATRLCTDPRNKPVEHMLVDSMVTAFQRSQVTHKLGVLYIIDAVARPWFIAGPEHAGGIRRLTDAMPALMNDYILVVPESQKDKVVKLLDIWITTTTFPVGMIKDFKQRIQAPLQPPSQPAPQAMAPQVTQQPNLANVNPAALLAALAQQNAPPGQQSPMVQQLPPSFPTANANAALAAMGIPFSLPPTNPISAPPAVHYSQPPVNPPMNYPPQQQPVAQPFAFPTQSPAQPTPQIPVSQSQPNFAPPQAANPNPLAALLGNVQGNDPAALLGQLQALQTLSQQLGPDAFRTLVSALGVQLPGAALPAAAPAPAYVNSPQAQQGSFPGAPANFQPAQPYGDDRIDSRNRDRSRSPDSKRRRVSPPNRRESPTYGTYDPNASRDSRGQEDRRGRNGFKKGGKPEYRTRSPPRNQPSRDVNSPTLKNNQPKPISWDNKLPDGHVKVLSRTLFVGGVKTTEANLKSFFGQFGTVQTCIVNHDKRHAFLKMTSHQEASAVKHAIGVLPETEFRHMFERVNWAVGFGPTQYADYNVGESVIPIDCFTDADRKWMVTAEYGGTGGQVITPGMIVEEPDIEIGTGPSSKAIHRRGGGGGGGRGGFHGRRSGHGGERGGNGHRGEEHGRSRKERHEPPIGLEAHGVGVPPPVPTFGGPITGFPMNLR